MVNQRKLTFCQLSEIIYNLVFCVDDVEDALKDLTTPIMWITGTSDCICTPEFQIGEYHIVSSSCKVIVRFIFF